MIRNNLVSRIHVSFKKILEMNDLIVYRVESIDFGDDELIGEIRINKSNWQYQFSAQGAFLGKCIIPPHVFDMPEDHQLAAIKRDYPDGEFKGTSSRIARMVNKLLKERAFPNEFHGAT